MSIFTSVLHLTSILGINKLKQNGFFLVFQRLSQIFHPALGLQRSSTTPGKNTILIGLQQSVLMFLGWPCRSVEEPVQFRVRKSNLKVHITGFRSVCFSSLKHDFSFVYFLVLLNIFIHMSLNFKEPEESLNYSAQIYHSKQKKQNKNPFCLSFNIPKMFVKWSTLVKIDIIQITKEHGQICLKQYRRCSCLFVFGISSLLSLCYRKIVGLEKKLSQGSHSTLISCVTLRVNYLSKKKKRHELDNVFLFFFVWNSCIQLYMQLNSYILLLYIKSNSCIQLCIQLNSCIQLLYVQCSSCM